MERPFRINGLRITQAIDNNNGGLYYDHVLAARAMQRACLLVRASVKPNRQLRKWGAFSGKGNAAVFPNCENEPGHDTDGEEQPKSAVPWQLRAITHVLKD